MCYYTHLYIIELCFGTQLNSLKLVEPSWPHFLGRTRKVFILGSFSQLLRQNPPELLTQPMCCEISALLMRKEIDSQPHRSYRDASLWSFQVVLSPASAFSPGVGRHWLLPRLIMMQAMQIFRMQSQSLCPFWFLLLCPLNSRRGSSSTEDSCATVPQSFLVYCSLETRQIPP